MRVRWVGVTLGRCVSVRNHTHPIKMQDQLEESSLTPTPTTPTPIQAQAPTQTQAQTQPPLGPHSD
jgi:hypothetical protein